MDAKKQLTPQWVLDLGPPRHAPPTEAVLNAITKHTGYDLRDVFNGISEQEISRKAEKFEGFSFLRSAEELEALLDYFPSSEFAPFGVSYNLSKKRQRRKSIDWFIDVYGVCFEGQFADRAGISVWSDHAYVFGWPSFGDFLNHWNKE